MDQQALCLPEALQDPIEDSVVMLEAATWRTTLV